MASKYFTEWDTKADQPRSFLVFLILRYKFPLDEMENATGCLLSSLKWSFLNRVWIGRRSTYAVSRDQLSLQQNSLSWSEEISSSPGTEKCGREHRWAKLRGQKKKEENGILKTRNSVACVSYAISIFLGNTVRSRLYVHHTRITSDIDHNNVWC